MSEERVIRKLDEVQESIARIDERQKNVMKELGEVKKLVMGNGLSKRVTTLEIKQENKEKWFDKKWPIYVGIGMLILSEILSFFFG